MALEIERKFLVCGDFRPFATAHHRMVQGYLCADGGRTVRVRLRDREGFLTIKGPSRDGGRSRYEWEQPLTMDDALSLLTLSATPLIDKVRWLVPVGQHVFEVDEFHGENEGLIVAEVELSDPDEFFECPEWLGEEVTGDRRYYNSALTAHPFSKWECNSDRLKKH